MGVYDRLIVPRLLDLAMRNRLLDRYRQRTIETARGLVLEVGVGSGLNLPLYGPAVARVVGLDPSPQLLRLASIRAADSLVPCVAAPRIGGAWSLRTNRGGLDKVIHPWDLG